MYIYIYKYMYTYIYMHTDTACSYRGLAQHAGALGRGSAASGDACAVAGGVDAAGNRIE